MTKIPDRPVPQIGFTLSPLASFWVSAAVVVHTLWTSAAPAMTYPLYEAEWHLTPTMTTAIFSVYPLFVVAALILFGDVSDYIGRRATMLLGLGSSLTGVFLFAVAPDIYWIFVGRAFMGFAVGLSAAPSAAAVLEFSPSGQAQRAGAITAASQAFGLAAALVVGGALIEYAPHPTRLNFAVLFVILGALFATAWFLPRHTSGEAKGPWRMKLPQVARGLGQIFATSTIAITCSYSIGAMMLSLGSHIAHDLIGSNNVLVSGAAMAVFPVVSGTLAIFAKRLPSGTQIIGGGIGSILGMGLLVLSSYERSLPLFLLSVAGGGAGYSLLFLGGLNLINANAPVHHRGGTLSTVFLIAYVMQGVVALSLGVMATAWGLRLAIEIGSAALALFGLAAMALAFSCRACRD